MVVDLPLEQPSKRAQVKSSLAPVEDLAVQQQTTLTPGGKEEDQ